MKKLICSLVAIWTITACTEKPSIGPDPNPQSTNVWILNEGNFQAGNCELGVYDLEKGEYSPKVFASVNNRPLGDILQSATEIDGEMYLVVNNSGKIEILNSSNFESTGTIKGFPSPRYMLQVSPSTAYVSDLFSDSVAVVNLAAGNIDHFINISSSSEQMVMAQNKVFITNTYSNHITVLNSTDESYSTINTTFNPTAIGLDKNNKIWVLCGGDATNNINGALEVIDPVSEQVDRTIALSSASYTNRMVFNTSHDSLYILTGDVYALDINATMAPSSALIKGINHSFYALGYRQKEKEIWLGDAKDFNQKGEVYIYSSGGKLKSSFTAGINPNEFWFGH